MIKVPAKVEVHETELSTFWFDAEGILMSLSKPPVRTVANCAANYEAVKRISGGRKPKLLIHLCSSPVPDKETRAFVARELPNVYTAMAMVSDSGLGAIIMNVLFKLKPPALPMKTFSNEQAAREWLKQFPG